MSWKRAKKTVADVEKWGRESAEYANEQRKKRGEPVKPKRGKGKR
ncbi:hypothetical protein [Amycolatopsis palatopharyngis]|nr:hypothetical protein [Amycolatopsis palatopharyngis]